MSALDSFVAENYIFDSSIDKSVPDSNHYVVKQRNITPIIDQQRGNGNYSSGRVIVDAQTFGNGADFIDWKNAYITLPYVITLSATAGITSTVAGTYDHNMLTALKNHCLIENLRVEQAGRTIVQESNNLSHLVNFIKHCTTTQDDLNSQTVQNAYYPDGSFNASCAASLQGVANVNNFGLSGTYLNSVNDGLVKRQQALYPANQFGNSAFSSSTNQANEYGVFQSVSSAPTTINTTTTNLSDIHFVAVIYLKDISDYFAKHPISKGVGYKFTFTINQATSTASRLATTTPFNATPTIAATSLVGSATCQPAMLCLGAGTLAGNSSITATSTTYGFTLTSAVDTTANSRQQGVIMYVPSYVLSEEYEAKLLSSPVIQRTPFMVNSAVYTSQTANAPINLQLFNAISNPRALIVIPQYATGSQTQASNASPLNPSPSVSDAQLSLTKIQVRVNSRSLLPNPSNYAYQQFIDNTSRIFKLNGGEGSITSGVIDLQKFNVNYRYYAFDLTSTTPPDQRDIPQLITFEAFNNSAVNVDLYVYVLYEQSATFDVLKGSVDIM
jgi:hypothetical protein